MVVQTTMSVVRDIARFFVYPKSRIAAQLRETLTLQYGLEIGGPSSIFSWSGSIPVYSVAKRIDNAVFAQKTIWANHNGRYRVSAEEGQTIFCEASELAPIANGTYDFLLASHVLEHIANPIKALHAWRRVVKPSVPFLIVVPDKERSFDRLRPMTSMQHMIDDFEKNVGEDDLSHLEETVQLHDYSKHNPCRGPIGLRKRSLLNLENRCLHHHVFTSDNFTALLDFSGFCVLHLEKLPPHHIFAYCST